VEDYDGFLAVAMAAKEAGCEFLRGGAFKPRTSPYDFQGYEEKALEYMKRVGEKTGLLTVTEVMDACDLQMICDYVDVVQIGARNVQNFKLLRAAGKCNKPVLLKRGLSSTIREFLLAAEHILYHGNPDVILCERGIRSFDDHYTRNVMDIAAVPVIKKFSHLPIIIDPSHGTGQRYLVEPMAKAGLVVGADGVMIEVHHDPENALSDGKQSLPIESFRDVMKNLNYTISQLLENSSSLNR
jgi:3-deoxy-7-phosphoheptulonate synthase